MNRTTVTKHAKRLALGLAVLALAAAPSFAQTTVDLCATTGSVTMPDGTIVPIWGFAAGDCTGGAPATLPGPEIRATAGELLTVNLTNNLTEPVSFFAPGLLGPAPTGGEQFTTEAAAGGGTAVYTFTPSAGTYLYHSATSRIRTHLPMGLYGALVVDEAPGCAYDDPGTPAPCDVSYDQDQVLVYSEIDPSLNADPANFGGARVSQNTLPVDVVGRVYGWKPQYFLINGDAYDTVTPPAPIAVAIGDNVLLRYVNAGLETVVPTLGGGLYMELRAEDGNLLPVAVSQFGIELQPGKTIDAMVNIADIGTYALFDRAFNLTNADATGGGMLAYIEATGPNMAPVALDDVYDATEFVLLSVPAPGVLTNDSDPEGDPMTVTTTPVVAPTNGNLTLYADGSFDYTSTVAAPANDSFTYEVCDPEPLCDTAVVFINIAAPNVSPIALDDVYSTDQDVALVVPAPGVLTNDSDPDSGPSPLTAVPQTGPTNGGLTLNADGSFTYTPNAGFAGFDSFTYTAFDGLANSAPATVTITVVGPASIVYFSTLGGGSSNPVPGVAGPYDDADIYTWDGSAFGRFFDANVDLGLPASADVDGFVYVSDTEFYMSFNVDGVLVPGLGAVQDEDVLHYNAGVWSVFFDGTAQGLTLSGNDVDAIDIVGGVLYFSATGIAAIPGVTGALDDADVYTWDGAVFARYFDGSAAGLPPVADINGLQIIDGTRLCVSLFSLGDVGTNVANLGVVQDEDIICSSDGEWMFYFNGSDFGLDVSKGQNIDSIAIINLPTNAEPIAVGDAHTINQDTPLDIVAPGVLGNDTDPDFDLLTAVLVSPPAVGTIDCPSDPVTYDLCPDGSFVYTPGAGATGDDSFTYVANDGTVDSAPATVTITVVPFAAQTALYFSTIAGGGTNPVPGVSGPYDDADIYTFDLTTSTFGRLVDATVDLGLAGTADIDGFHYVSDTEFYVSFNVDGVSVPGLGTVEDEDVVHFNAGTWSVFFDGTALGLTDSGHDIDAFDIDGGGVLYFSTLGGNAIPGVAGTGDDADIYSWDGVAFGRLIDASADLALPNNADVIGFVYVSSTDFYVTFQRSGGTNIPGFGIVQDEDVVHYNNGAWSMFFDGSVYGLDATDGQNLDAIDFVY